jgi:hypothetical protein
VTSLSAELGRDVTIAEVLPLVEEQLHIVFDPSWKPKVEQ